MNHIPLFKVAVHPDAGARVAETLASGYVGEGRQTAAFEAAFGDLVGLDPAPLAVNSCTAAIDLALHLIGVGPGDAVVSTPMTCTATNGAIVQRGARIVWADVDPLTGLMDPADVARKMGPGVKAIVAVDWGGRACDYRALRRHGVPVIEDAAHRLFPAHGTPGGDYVAWSFGPIKHLTCGGYGGALLTPPPQRERARLLRWHGLDRTSRADFRCEQTIHEAGFKYHLTDDLATVGLANLELAAGNVVRAIDNAYWYDRVLRNVSGVRVAPFDSTSDYWLYDVLVDGDREGFMRALADAGIATSRVHARNDTHPAYTFPSGPLPGVDAFDAQHVCIPVGWWLTPEDREHIVRTIIGWSQSAAPAEALIQEVAYA